MSCVQKARRISESKSRNQVDTSSKLRPRNASTLQHPNNGLDGINGNSNSNSHGRKPTFMPVTSTHTAVSSAKPNFSFPVPTALNFHHSPQSAFASPSSSAVSSWSSSSSSVKTSAQMRQRALPAHSSVDDSLRQAGAKLTPAMAFPCLPTVPQASPSPFSTASSSSASQNTSNHTRQRAQAANKPFRSIATPICKN